MPMEIERTCRNISTKQQHHTYKLSYRSKRISSNGETESLMLVAGYHAGFSCEFATAVPMCSTLTFKLKLFFSGSVSWAVSFTLSIFSLQSCTNAFSFTLYLHLLLWGSFGITASKNLMEKKVSRVHAVEKFH